MKFFSVSTKHFTWLTFTLLTNFWVCVPEVKALTINRNFQSVLGEPSTNTAGGGSLETIFDVAADWWELAILDEHTIDINFGWLALPDSIGAAININPVVMPTQATILFDNSLTAWFLDSTPHQNEEYDLFFEYSEDLGGGPINTGYVYVGATGDAEGRFDLLTVAKHEIGHALGFLDSIENGFSDPITITEPRPLPGTEIPTNENGGGHTSIETSLLYNGIVPNQRKLLSSVDIIAVAQLSNFEYINLNPTHSPTIPHEVPEPLSLLGTTVAIGFGINFRRRKIKPYKNEKKDF